MLEFRLGLFQAEERYAKELVEAIQRHPGCCDGVWLTTMGYYPPLWKHEEYARQWIESAKLFRDAGLTVSLQIANTIGHGDFDQLEPARGDLFSQGMMPQEGESPYMVGSDGTQNIGCFCWRSEQLRSYMCSVVTIYAKVLTLYRLWFDDDLRAHNHAPNKHGCFCDRCIQAFNETHNTHFTREELVWEINYGDPLWRDRYVTFCRRGLYDFTYAMAKACLAVSPDTCFGWEYSHSRHYMGGDDEHVLGALRDASGKEVATRPGGNYYNDKAPWEQYEKGFILSAANSLLEEYVTERLAEIENLPGVVFGKSIGGIINEGTVDLAMGCTGLTFTDVQSCHEPIGYYERIFERLTAARPYWERLSRLSQGAHRGGVAVYVGEAPHLRKLSKGEAPFSWEKLLRERDIQLMRLGVPISYDRGHPTAYLLHHETVDALTDRDIAYLLTQPVITDGACIAKLLERGYAEYFPLTPIEIGTITEEHFPPCKLNPQKAGLFYNENPYAATPMQRYIFENLNERTTILGEAYNGYHLGDGRRLGACTVVTTLCLPNGQKGVQWAIFGYSIWNDLVSSAKREQILSALDAIGPMPVRLRSEEQAVVIPAVDNEGRVLAVTLSSASQSGTDTMTFTVRNPKGARVYAMGARRAQVPVKLLQCSETEQTLQVDALMPYEIVTVFWE